MTRQKHGLAWWITERRKARRLSVSAAARAAGVARSTWIAWEAGRATPQDANYAAIEAALAWSRGSIEAILNNSSPTPLPDGEDAAERDFRDYLAMQRPRFTRAQTERLVVVWREERGKRSAGGSSDHTEDIRCAV